MFGCSSHRWSFNGIPKELPVEAEVEVTEETADTSKSLDFEVPAVKVPASFLAIWKLNSFSKGNLK